MPIHDWTRVDAGIFHDFHHEWISTIRRALNDGLLPSDYYALAEQQAAGFGPDVLTLQGTGGGSEGESSESSGPSRGGLLLAPPRVRFTAQADFHRRKQSAIVVRHTSGDDVVAVVEIVSPSNKHSRASINALIHKACELLEAGIHLLVLDLFPPTKRDPAGLHAALWEELVDETFTPPPNQPLTLVGYESANPVRAFVEPAAVGEALPDMPLFLETGAHVPVPLERTYMAAYDTVPLRWRRELDAAA
jgi:hypothetical protein